MPVKKRVTTKKGNKITKAERESIKQAVNSLSGLVIDQAPKMQPIQKPVAAPQQIPVSKPTPAPIYSIPVKKTEPIRYHNSKLEEKKRKVMWFAVGTLMLFIAAFWIVSIQLRVKNSGFHSSADGQLLETAFSDYNKIIKEPREALLKLKEQTPPAPAEPLSSEQTDRIKEVLAQNLLAMHSSTSTTSTINVTTSTLSVTSTKE